MKRTRRIRIAWMRSNWYVRRWQWGVPHGFYLQLAGHCSAVDPCEFITWREVLWAIDTRLRMAGLKRVGEVMRRAIDFWEELTVAVQRI